MTGRRFSHAFDLAFSLVSGAEDASDVTPAMLKAALLQRIADLDAHGEWLEATGVPLDTYEESADGCRALDILEGISDAQT